jgi:hypothetical protein
MGSNARQLLERNAAARTQGSALLERGWSHNRKSAMLLLMLKLQLLDHS